MGLQRKILGKRTIQQVPEEVEAASIPQLVELRPVKLKRSHSSGCGDEDEDGARQLASPSSANGAGTERHCPLAPKKPRLELGCSLDGFKVLRVTDLRCFLR